MGRCSSRRVRTVSRAGPPLARWKRPHAPHGEHGCENTIAKGVSASTSIMRRVRPGRLVASQP
eukprot:370523-Lingulodinium_polyedra.AAC.1